MRKGGAMKRLIVNADDLGISLETNRAIADSFQRGIVTSASLLVNMSGFASAVQVSEEHPDLQVGLHLCLTSGRSLLPAEDVPLLVDSQRRFRHSFVGLWRLLRSRDRQIALVQIAAEVHAQWERARQHGVSLGHVDSHQHVHMLPALFPVVAELARQARVPLRVPDEPWRITSLMIGPRRITKGTTGLLKVAMLAVCARQNAGAARAVRRSDICFGILHSGRMTREVLEQLVSTLPDGVTELITHPSWETALDGHEELTADDRGFLLSPFRRSEYEALTDPGVRRRLEHTGVQLLRRHESCSWRVSGLDRNLAKC